MCFASPFCVGRRQCASFRPLSRESFGWRGWLLGSSFPRAAKTGVRGDAALVRQAVCLPSQPPAPTPGCVPGFVTTEETEIKWDEDGRKPVAEAQIEAHSDGCKPTDKRRHLGFFASPSPLPPTELWCSPRIPRNVIGCFLDFSSFRTLVGKLGPSPPPPTPREPSEQVPFGTRAGVGRFEP